MPHAHYTHVGLVMRGLPAHPYVPSILLFGGGTGGSGKHSTGAGEAVRPLHAYEFFDGISVILTC
jgi:hypothetical protein